MTSGISKRARHGAVLVAIVAGITLILRLYLKIGQTGGLFEALSFLSQYFTILTNFLVFLMMLWIALGRSLSPRLIQTVVIAIVCVGAIYHTLLAHLVSLSGLELWADHGTHTFVPILAGLWWLFLAPLPGFKGKDIVVWVAWPVIYCVYILIRAQFSGFYPYPFLNVPEIGVSGLMTSIVGLLVGFILVGFTLLALARMLRRS